MGLMRSIGAAFARVKAALAPSRTVVRTEVPARPTLSRPSASPARVRDFRTPVTSEPDRVRPVHHPVHHNWFGRWRRRHWTGAELRWIRAFGQGRECARRLARIAVREADTLGLALLVPATTFALAALIDWRLS